MNEFDQDLPVKTPEPDKWEDAPVPESKAEESVDPAPESVTAPDPEEKKENTMSSSGFFVPSAFSAESDSAAAAAPKPDNTETVAPRPAPTVPQPVIPAPVAATNANNKLPPVRPAKKKESKKVPLAAFIAVTLVFCILFALCLGSLFYINGYWKKQLDQAVEDGKKDLISGMMFLMDKIPEGSVTSAGDVNLAPSQVYNNNVKAVVMILCEVKTGAGFFSTTGYSSGSGFIISQDGYVLTNAHVVDDASSIAVTMYSGETLDATLVGKDEYMDVALLKVEGEQFPCVTIGKSANVIVGEQVAAIGNPLGNLDFSMSVGYVSAKDRTVDAVAPMIQTDLAINSGNSGGPLFNMAGQVIGITSSKYSGTSSSGASIEGISFSIPIDDVMAILPELKSSGKISYAYLGVSVGNALPDPEAGTPAGAIVGETFTGYAAQKAGILAGDIITQLAGYPVDGVNSLTAALRNFKPGDEVSVVVHRNGEEVTITLTLDERPEE